MKAWRVRKHCSGSCLRGRRNSRPLVCLPLPRQQFLQAGGGKIGDAGEHIGNGCPHEPLAGSQRPLGGALTDGFAFSKPGHASGRGWAY